MTVEEKDKGGRPPHVPDDKTRKTVEAMSSYGIPQEDIAKVIGLDPKTLRKHYEYELDTAEIKANAQVAQRLYQKCMNDDTSSIIFWLKTRAQWKETIKQESQLLGKDGNPADQPTMNIFINGVAADDRRKD